MTTTNSGPMVVGLTGYARSGKSTVAEYLHNKHGFTVLHFADALKAMAKRIDPLLDFDGDDNPVHLSDLLTPEGEFPAVFPEDNVKVQYPEYRRFLQRLGTEGLRYLDDRFWLEQLYREISRLSHHGVDKFVIPDCRFPNEAQFIFDELPMDGCVTALVEVVRPGVERGTHASEAYAGRMGENWELVNDGTLMELAGKTDDLVVALKNGVAS